MTGGGDVSGMAVTGVWVNRAGRLGMAAGPDGGARLIAGPLGASGTEAGGTGGGRSPNNWAEATCGIEAARSAANASKGHWPQPDLNRR